MYSHNIDPHNLILNEKVLKSKIPYQMNSEVSQPRLNNEVMFILTVSMHHCLLEGDCQVFLTEL